MATLYPINNLMLQLNWFISKKCTFIVKIYLSDKKSMENTISNKEFPTPFFGSILNQAAKMWTTKFIAFTLINSRRKSMIDLTIFTLSHATNDKLFDFSHLHTMKTKNQKR